MLLYNGWTFKSKGRGLVNKKSFQNESSYHINFQRNTKFGDNRETEDGISDGVWNPDVYLYIGDYSGTDASVLTVNVRLHIYTKATSCSGCRCFFRVSKIWECKSSDKTKSHSNSRNLQKNLTFHCFDESPRNHIGWYGLGAAGLLASILLLGMKKTM
mgnify:CR=1 FL=1